ncbi:MAG: hypothetical protein Q9201_004930 [Fulgogasparrea decipioides]
MDPLSCTASVCTLIEALTKTVNYVIAVRNAPKELKDLIKKLREIRLDLESYLDLVQKAQEESELLPLSRLPNLSRLANPENSSSDLAVCLKEVETLNTSLAPVSSLEESKTRAVLQALKWPFKKETRKILDTFGNLRDRLASARGNDQASNAIEDLSYECHQHPEKALGYFYFTFNNAANQRSGDMLRSLLEQFSRQNTASMEILEGLYSSCNCGSTQPTDQLLLSTLKAMIACFSTTYVILDALDESEPRPTLLATISEIILWHVPQLRFVGTSRREADIAQALEPLAQESNIIEIRSALIHDDVRTYIRLRLSQDTQLVRWWEVPEFRDKIEVHLAKKADGMFRWVECQLDTLRSCLSQEDLEEALETLPEGLNETYMRILRKIDARWRKRAIKALHWLVCSKRPLYLTELVEALAVDVDSEPRFSPRRMLKPGDILRICSSLVTITAEQSYHPSSVSDPQSKANDETIDPLQYMP